MPFVLVGPAHNLKYLKSYGFKTFDRWFDESYDDIEDPSERMAAIIKTMEQICSYSLEELQNILLEMVPILEHNYNLFYSTEFIDSCWGEMLTNLKQAISDTNLMPNPDRFTDNDPPRPKTNHYVRYGQTISSFDIGKDIPNDRFMIQK
jgi:uncharacterized protein YejL (UPF0352 family)